MPSNTPLRSALRIGHTRSLLRPLLTSRSGSTPSPFQAQGEISPGKNALLRCTTAGFTPQTLGHKSFAVVCPLALLGNAFYPVLIHRRAASIHASFPHSVARMQLRFTSLAVTSLRRDSHPQEYAHAGRTNRVPGEGRGPWWRPRDASGTSAGLLLRDLMLHPAWIPAFAGIAGKEVRGKPEKPIAVGTRVTTRPPHRSARAAFPHAAPTLGE